MSYVTGISGNVISAASAGYAPTNSAEVSAIASAYATGAEQVVTSLQYATSQSSAHGDTTTGSTGLDYGRKWFSADYYGGGGWGGYTSAYPPYQVRVTANGNIRNYSSYPYYLFMAPIGATDGGRCQNPDYIDLSRFGNLDPWDCLIAVGEATAVDGSAVIDFEITELPLSPNGFGVYCWSKDGVGAPIGADLSSTPAFGIAGGPYGNEFFEIDYDYKELDFGEMVTTSAVSGINELNISPNGYATTADVSALSAEIGDINTLLQSI